MRIIPFLIFLSIALTGYSADEVPLRELAAKRGMLIGAAANMMIQRGTQYAETLAREMNILTPENELKFHRTHPAEDRYDFQNADALVDFAETNGMKVRGHTLIWHQSIPRWMRDREWTRDELLNVMRDHIQAVAGRYKGRIYAWDVVNEYFDNKGEPRKSLWSETLGSAYMEYAHHFALEADPSAKLIVNEYDIENINAKSDGMYRRVKDYVDRGVPVDGVGFQMHVLYDWRFDADEFARNLQRFADLGLEIHITELDVRIKQPVTPEKLKKQADLYAAILRTCLDQPACKVFIMWGFTDRFSWIPFTFKGFGDGLIFDRDFQPKPAYEAIHEVLSR
ncbi:MAG: 1,4-beta-xylanase [bacterium]|nr:1,4-beta-xylanase [bacterium]